MIAKSNSFNRIIGASVLFGLLSVSVTGCSQSTFEGEAPITSQSATKSETKVTPKPIEQTKPTKQTEESDSKKTESETWLLEWNSYEVVEDNKINFKFQTNEGDRECSGHKVAIKVDETDTTVKPEFISSMPEDPSTCMDNRTFSIGITLKEPLGEREILK